MAYWDAFGLLSRFREYNQNREPKAFTLGDIKTYCDFVGIKEASQRLVTAEMILELDSEWFALERERVVRERENEERKRRLTAQLNNALGKK